MSGLNSEVKIWCKTQWNEVSASFTWTIVNFITMTEAMELDQKIESDIFTVGSNCKNKWMVQLYPKGGEEKFKDHLSIYLYLEASSEPYVRAKCRFCIVKTENENEISWRGYTHDYKPKGGLGYPGFVSNKGLFNNDKKLLHGEDLVILCEITVYEGPLHNSGTDHILSTACTNQILQDFKKIHADGKFTDVTLSAGDKELKAHRNVLAARSAVFEAMFDHEMLESRNNRVVITDIDYDVMSEMLYYIYTGTIHSIGEMTPKLFVSADKYALTHLKNLCEETLIKDLTIENAAQTLLLADQHSAGRLKSQTIDFIKGHLAQVIETVEFGSIVQPHLMKELLLSVAAQKISSESK